MRNLLIFSALCFFAVTAGAQVIMPADKKFYKHSYYPLLEKDTLQLSFLRSEDRKLLPPLDSLLKQYLVNYHLMYDSSKTEVTSRRVEYHADEKRTFVWFAPMFVNEYQMVEGKIYIVKQGKDTISITGMLSNNRPYRVRFWVDNMKRMTGYENKLDAMIKPKKVETTRRKKELSK